jgi:hypothetical protein
MRSSLIAVIAGVSALLAGSSHVSAAQLNASSSGAITHNIIQLSPNPAPGSAPAQFYFKTLNLLPAKTRQAVAAGLQSGKQPEALGYVTIPLWQASVSFAGPVQNPFTMVGRSPQFGGTTAITTQLLPITVVFQGSVDPSSGGPVTLTMDTQTIDQVLLGPDFQKASYDVGTTQFADAIQRAEFFPVEKATWHTLIKPSKVLAPVTIYVPDSVAGTSIYQIGQLPDGTFFAWLDYNFFTAELQTILGLERLNPRGLVIPLVRNIGLYENGNIADCCVAGFHAGYETMVGQQVTIQTFAYATWLDSGIGQAVAGRSSFSDIMPLSHEISEWMNDPFGDNLVIPSWQFPGSTNCQGNLEVGDPVEVLPDSYVSTPLYMNGYTYHPQNMALFQWFAQDVPSNAVDGAYSYPDETALPLPSASCP